MERYGRQLHRHRLPDATALKFADATPDGPPDAAAELCADRDTLANAEPGALGSTNRAAHPSTIAAPDRAAHPSTIAAPDCADFIPDAAPDTSPVGQPDAAPDDAIPDAAADCTTITVAHGHPVDRPDDRVRAWNLLRLGGGRVCLMRRRTVYRYRHTALAHKLHTL